MIYRCRCRIGLFSFIVHNIITRSSSRFRWCSEGLPPSKADTQEEDQIPPHAGWLAESKYEIVIEEESGAARFDLDQQYQAPFA